MLFSASDDGTIRLWDLTQRTCVRQLTGHVGQVQSLRLLVDEDCEGQTDSPSTTAQQEIAAVVQSKRSASRDSIPLDPSSSIISPYPTTDSEVKVAEKRKKPMLVSGSLDNTIKLWDIETGKTTRTFFGHIEGVWGVASDKLRLVSGSHDRTIKVCDDSISMFNIWNFEL